MSLLRYRTAGESHGPVLTALLEGIPAGLLIDRSRIDAELARRQKGYGRGGRMAIETDRAEILAGVRWGKTTGAPVVLGIRNRDWENWREGMSPDPDHAGSIPPVTQVRPGHADLPGALKYGLADAREVLERSSARETAARVAAGAVTKLLLELFDIRIGSFVTSVGSVHTPLAWSEGIADWWGLHDLAEGRVLRIPEPEVDRRAALLVDQAREEGDSLGGTFVCFATGVPLGLGSHVSWEERLDGRLGRAFFSIPAIKGVEVGIGFGAAELPGSRVHDEIFPGSDEDRRRGRVRRETNRAGGMEGGITNGEVVWVKAAMKPIPTLMKPLRTIDLATGLPVLASRERSDVCAVPAASVVGEAALALELASALLEKLGGDCLEELRTRYTAHLDRVCARWPKP